MMVVHARCSRSRRQRRRDFFVFQPLLCSEQEDFTLQPRQLPQTRREQRLGFARLGMLMRVSGPVANAFIERQYLPPRRPPAEILQHVAADRQQPGAELTLSAKPVHASERADERL